MQQSQQSLHTERLNLRPFSFLDIERLTELANDPRVAYTTAALPKPYRLVHAIRWVAEHEQLYTERAMIHYALDEAASGVLMGTMGLTFLENNTCELGYWLGSAYWGKGYCTEAGCAVVDYAFSVLGLEHLVASHLTRNPGSGRVLEKLGFEYTRTAYESFCKWGIYEHQDYYKLNASS